MLIPLGILAVAGAGVAGGVAGYFIGGETLSGASGVRDKLAFANDTISTLSATTARNASGSFSNNEVAGYYFGGSTAVEKSLYPSDTTSNLGTGLSVSRVNPSGVSNSGVAGYAFESQQLANKFAFPGDARTTLNAAFFNNWTNKGSVSNSGTAGYLGGGSNNRTAVEKFEYATDTHLGNLGTGLSSGRAYSGGFANKGVAGYFAGGVDLGTGTSFTTIDKYAFPGDTRTTLGTGLTAAKYGANGLSNSTVAGYVGGGAQPGTYLTTIEKFAYPSDTRSVLATGLSAGRSTSAAFADERF
jgi:hypothetical protein